MFNIIDKSCRYMQTRPYSIRTSSKDVTNLKKYQQTIFLPKTNFPRQLKPKEVQERDKRILEEGRFLNFYSWQRKHLKGKEFVLHDGPPYANGKPHIGHAINKILKDIFLRSQTVQGHKVHFMPGWDCHGLPIELIATKGINDTLGATQIRRKAKELAMNMLKVQKEAFKEWGVMGDWENKCYYTCSADYIVNQLKVFWKMYERGLIYHDLKPVYWSPSSQTALAEAELLYKNHTSPALTVRFETTESSNSEPIYLLVWTTTPWTLPLNAAVYFSSRITYSLINIESLSGSYIIAKDMIQSLEKRMEKNISIISDLSTDMLEQLKYKHPWNPEKVLKVLESCHVKLAGTGLLHSVPGHGHEDFIMGLANNLRVECFIDEKGFYMPNAGEKLSGLNVQSEGSQAVIEHLSSEIILQENFSHSYPYDWRTNKPVIIRASNQWFIDTDKLKNKAIKSLNNVEVPEEYFSNNLRNRPYWCLSRQRTWGVPIPAFFHRSSKRPLVSRDLIEHLCRLIKSDGPDVWWTMKVEDLFLDSSCRDLFVKKEDVIKGEDIMDIWFDSGISWSYALQGKKADMYLEGSDQYGGWFQSSLLTSVATVNQAPYRRIVTHGFAVDEEGKKMSKSLGNVVDPEKVIKGDNALGVDTLRWWVGCHSHNALVQASNTVFKGDYDGVQKIRTTFRFILGALHDVTEDLLKEKLTLCAIDIFMLNSCYKFYHSVYEDYNAYDMHGVTSRILNFVPNEISSRYISVIKDRLYCDEKLSARRRACQFVLNEILNTLCHVVAPILPHLAEEVFMHHPIYKKNEKKLFYAKEPWRPAEWWKTDAADKAMFLLDDIKKEASIESNPVKMACLLEVEENEYQVLKEMQNEERSVDSELTEILQVAQVILKLSNCRKVSFSPMEANQCFRCRRYTAFEGNDVCPRCQTVISSHGKLK